MEDLIIPKRGLAKKRRNNILCISRFFSDKAQTEKVGSPIFYSFKVGPNEKVPGFNFSNCILTTSSTEKLLTKSEEHSFSIGRQTS